jgi:SLT domain-containing protein
MKKLFDFIKNLFSKADEVEQKVEQFVAKSDFISPTIKNDVQSALNKVNELEAKTKKVVAKAEVAEQQIETAIKNKDIVSATIAVESVKDVAADATSLANDVKQDVEVVKKKRRYYTPKNKTTKK